MLRFHLDDLCQKRIGSDTFGFHNEASCSVNRLVFFNNSTKSEGHQLRPQTNTKNEWRLVVKNCQLLQKQQIFCKKWIFPVDLLKDDVNVLIGVHGNLEGIG